MFVAVQCRHCPEPLCVYACLTGAMQQDPLSGNVSLDPERCIGCWTCILACPYGAIRRDLERGVAAKCDLCPDLEVPACVVNCPNEALVFTEDGASA
jgi:carbon-monoxide dehydrogenase iron sulfur subunit